MLSWKHFPSHQRLHRLVATILKLEMDLVSSQGCESWWPGSMVPWYLLPPHRPIFYFTKWWRHLFLCCYLLHGWMSVVSSWNSATAYVIFFHFFWHKCTFSVKVNFILKLESLCFGYMWVEEIQLWLAKLSPELMLFVACFHWLLVVVVTPDIRLSGVWVFHNWGGAGCFCHDIDFPGVLASDKFNTALVEGLSVLLLNLNSFGKG